MKIEDIGILTAGIAGELTNNCISIYNSDQYPIIEIVGPVDEFGNFLYDDKDLQDLAADLVGVWNETIISRLRG